MCPHAAFLHNYALCACAQLCIPTPGRTQDCIDLDEARRSYFSQLFPLNPGAIVPSGPTAADLELHLPPGRGSASFADAFHLAQRSTAAV
jgi:glutathionyl-hydroquinone reductase